MGEQRIPKGYHKGKGIKGSEQYGTTKNGNDQICIDLQLTELGEVVQTFLYFSDASAEYEIPRLRALGWQGDDLSDLTGIDANEVDVQVDYEMYEGKQQMKVRIMTGGGRVVLQQTMNDQAKRLFAAKFKGLAAASRGGATVTRPADPNMAGDGFPFGKNAPAQGGVKL